MADSELGELRRPPRLVEHRIERLTRHRAGGLLGGSSDAVMPVDGTDEVLAGAGDSGGGGDVAVPDWWHDTTTLTSGSAATWTLTFYPIEHSEVIRLNGIVLEVGVDYTIAGNVVTWLDLTGLRLGIGAATWTLSANYAYYDTAPTPFEPAAFTSWVRNGTATLVGGTEVRLTQAGIANQNGAIVCPDLIPSGWAEITVDMTLYIDAVNGDAIDVILWDVSNGTTKVAVNTENGLSMVRAETAPAADLTRFFSRDLTPTTINNTVSDSEMTFGVHTITTIWTKTGANTATVKRYRDGVLANSSPADVWVPSTVYVAIAAYDGALFYNEHTVRDAQITVT